MSLVNSGDDAHAEHTRRIRELLLDRCEEIEADPKTLRRAKATRERRDAEQRRRGEEARAARAREAERVENEHAERREELREVNAAFDALRVASEENRRAQQAVAFAENPRLNVRRPKATKPRDKKTGPRSKKKTRRGRRREGERRRCSNGGRAPRDHRSRGAPEPSRGAEARGARERGEALEGARRGGAPRRRRRKGGDGATRKTRGLTRGGPRREALDGVPPAKERHRAVIRGVRFEARQLRSAELRLLGARVGDPAETRGGGDRAGARGSFATLRDGSASIDRRR